LERLLSSHPSEEFEKMGAEVFFSACNGGIREFETHLVSNI